VSRSVAERKPVHLAVRYRNGHTMTEYHYTTKAARLRAKALTAAPGVVSIYMMAAPNFCAQLLWEDLT